MGTRIIAIANQKGGVGKTTTVISLAACLGELGRKVLVVDLDPQANATSGLGVPVQEGGSLYEAMLSGVLKEGVIRETAVDNVHLVPSELDLAGAEIEIARQDSYLHCASRVLKPLVARSDYEFVLVDCPPSLGILTMNGLTASDGMVVPMQCEYYALEGLSVITNLLNRVRKSGANPNLQLDGILMTMFDSRTNLSEQVVTEVREHFGEKVYRTVIPRNVRLSEAPSYGQPITIYDSLSPGARAYRFFAREFAKSQAEITPVIPS